MCSAPWLKPGAMCSRKSGCSQSAGLLVCRCSVCSALHFSLNSLVPSVECFRRSLRASVSDLESKMPSVGGSDDAIPDFYGRFRAAVDHV